MDISFSVCQSSPGAADVFSVAPTDDADRGTVTSVVRSS